MHSKRRTTSRLILVPLISFAAVFAPVGAQTPLSSVPPSIPAPKFSYSEEQSHEWNIVREVDFMSWTRPEEYRLDASPVPYPTNAAAIARLREARTMGRAAPNYMATVEAALKAARGAGDISAEGWALFLQARGFRLKKDNAAALAAYQKAEDAWMRTGFYPAVVEQIGYEIAILRDQSQFARIPARIALALELAEKEQTRHFSLAMGSFAVIGQLNPLTLDQVKDNALRAEITRGRDRLTELVNARLERLPPTLFQAEMLAWTGDCWMADYTLPTISNDAAAVEAITSAEARERARRAAVLYQNARQVFVTLSPVSPRARKRVPDCDSMLSTIALQHLNPVESRMYSRRAVDGYLSLPSELLTEETLKAAMEATSALAASEHITGSAKEAERLASAGLDLWRKAKYPAGSAPFVAVLYQILGDAARTRGELLLAQEAYSTGLNQIPVSRTMKPGALSRQTLIASLGAVAQLRGDYAVARDTYIAAAGEMRRVAGDEVTVASVLFNLSICYQKTGDLARAETTLNEAEAIYSKIRATNPELSEAVNGVAECQLRRGILTHARGLAALGEGRKEEADTLFQTALTAMEEARRRFKERNPLSIAVARVTGDIAVTLMDVGRRDEAEVQAREALKIYDQIAPDSLECAYLLGSLADCLMRKGAVNEAVTFAERGVALLERQRASVPNVRKRSLVLAQQADLFPTLIEGYLTQGKIAQAFHALEKSRARSLAESIAERDADAAKDLPAELRKAWDELEQERTLLYERLELVAGDDASPSRQEALAQLAALGRAEDNLIDRIRKEVPRYASIRYPEPLDLAQAQHPENLPEGTLFLSYFVGPHQSFLFIVTGGTKPTVRVVPLNIGEVGLSAKVERFVGNIIARKDRDLSQTPPYLPHSHELYTLLLAPAEEEIVRAKRLLICPDGPLSALPFAALAKPGADKQYLIDRKPFRLVPSLTLSKILRQGGGAKSARPLSALALGMPTWTPPANAPKPLPGLVGKKVLDGMRQEAITVAALFGTKALIGPAATEAALVRGAPKADILHLACHAIGGDPDPMNAHLSLAPTLQAGRTPRYLFDGDLNSWELYTGRMTLSAQLVTLSACETGRGRLVRYEGVDSLARAFLYAGARSVVYTLWETDDQVAAALMPAFYTHLKKGMSRDEALQAAIRTFRRQGGARSHPFYWSGFQLAGTDGPLL